MATLVPELAPVRPRVRGRGTDGARLLEELVEEYAEESVTGVVWLIGEKGAGKTTALAHLAAHFAGDPHFAFLDDADQLDEHVICQNHRFLGDDVLVVASRCEQSRTEQPQLRMEPWSVDELLEYLMPNHPQECGTVMNRLGADAHQSWLPEMARIVLDQMLADQELLDVESALLAYLSEQLPTRSLMAAARRYSLELQLGGSKSLVHLPRLQKMLPRTVCSVLHYRPIQLRLAAEQLGRGLQKWRPPRVLEQRLPKDLIRAVGKICQADADVQSRIKKLLSTNRHPRMHAMVASILFAADPTWRPEGKRTGRDFSGAHFAKANWSNICLAELPMQLADFSGAQLYGSNFDDAIVVKANFSKANLLGASFEKALATGTSFDTANMQEANLFQMGLENASLVGTCLRRADLSEANLCGADLTRACFEDAKLKDTILVGANLSEVDLHCAALQRVDARHVDLRTAHLSGACMFEARLSGANLEDVVWHRAKLAKAGLQGAHLTGSRLHYADLRGADLCAAGLGEIDWENADLRTANLSRATFHMGSSRSGLVGSPIASEGTRTGFYTDDLEELYFKSPEEVRKANLRGADLRGANLEHVDFYLVDLRDAKLEPHQRDQAAKTGAILSD